MANIVASIGPNAGADYQVYVGNLDPNVTNIILMSHFSKKYSSVYEAKVIIDMQTRQSKGYGFLRFSSPD